MSLRKKKRLNSDMVLQITSMADIFTIILVFLLKSFSTGVSTITPNSDMTLPESSKPSPITESLKLEVSSSSVTVEDKKILSLQEFRFTPTDLEENGTPRALNLALGEQRAKDPTQKVPQILILADSRTPYSTVKSVLASAATSGYMDYKLVVVEDQ